MSFITDAFERRRSGRRVFSRPIFLWLGSVGVALLASLLAWGLSTGTFGTEHDVLRPVLLRVYDQGLNSFAGRDHGKSQFAVVKFDENTANDMQEIPAFVPGLPGPYTWSNLTHRRALHARLIQNLKRLGARGVVFDVVFDREIPEVDGYLAEAIRDHGSVVLAGLIEESEGGAGQGQMKNLILPAPTLQEAAAGVGIANIPKDPDQIVRKFAWTFGGMDPLTLEDTNFPALGVAAAALAAERSPAEEAAAAAAGKGFLGRPLVSEGGPGERQSRFLYYGSATEPAGPGSLIEYENVVRRGQDEAALESLRSRVEGKVVLVGEVGKLSQDLHGVPVFGDDAAGRRSNQMPGVVIQTQIAQAALRGGFVRLAEPWQVFLLVLLTALAIALLGRLLSPLTMVFIALATLGALYFVSTGVVAASGFFLEPVTAAVAAVFALVGETGFMYAFERRERDAVKRQLRRHVGEGIANKLTDDDWSRLSGEPREITMLFSDLQGFTSISETLSSAEICSLLNRYFDVVFPVIARQGGTLDKLMGDGVMAYFGWPVRTPDHAERGVRCAIEIQEALEAWQRQPENAGMPQLRTRIGLHSGSATIGEIGGKFGAKDERVEFTVIGDVVNVASRLEGMNKEFGTTILISEVTRDLAGEFVPMQPRGVVTVRGRREPLQVFSIEPATAGAGGSRTAGRSASLRLDTPSDATEIHQ